MPSFPLPFAFLGAAFFSGADVTLTQPDGTPWRLQAQPAAKARVLVFLARDCPMSNAYLPTLARLDKQYRDRGVAFVGVFANAEDGPATLPEHAKEYGITFPLLHDADHAAVKAFGGTINPEAVVLDAAGNVVYRGRIDDGYSARLKPNPKVTREDLKLAIDAVLAGQPVAEPRTQAFGCPILPLKKAGPARSEGVTYHKHVVPLLQQHCQSCHRPGEVGPFALMTYAQAVRWGQEMVEFTQSRRMPPWKPEERHGEFANQRSLSEAEIATLAAWVKAGMPEGDPQQAPPPVSFPEGWYLGKPDLILELPSAMTVAAEGRDLMRCFVFPTNLPSDVFIAAIEVKPGNRAVVHHTLQFIDTSGRARKLERDFQARQKPSDPDQGPGYSTRMGIGFLPDPKNGLGGWAPGYLPRRLPAGVGYRLPKGADIVMQIHYHRTGKEEKDRTKVGLYFAKGPMKERLQGLAVPGLFLRIPAHESNYVVESGIVTAEDLTLHWLFPHMHLLGKSIELTMELPDGTTKQMIAIKEWDYNWQEMYTLKEPIKIPKGTKFWVKGVYDNSSGNPLNPHTPPRPVRFGEQTTDEMCFVFLGVSSPSEHRILPRPIFKR